MNTSRDKSISIFNIESTNESQKSFNQINRQSTTRLIINNSIEFISIFIFDNMSDNYQSFDFNQMQFNFMQIMIQKNIQTVIQNMIFESSKSFEFSKSQNTSTSFNVNDFENDDIR